MTLLKPQQKTSGYNTISDAIADDGTAAVVHRSLMWMGMIIAFVAGMMVTAGGAVWMQDESSYTTTACSSDYGTSMPCCGQPQTWPGKPGGNVPARFQCPASRPLCEGYIWNTIYMVTVQRARHPAMHVVREKGTRRDCFPAGTSNGFFDLTYTHFIM